MRLFCVYVYVFSNYTNTPQQKKRANSTSKWKFKALFVADVRYDDSFSFD